MNKHEHVLHSVHKYSTSPIPVLFLVNTILCYLRQYTIPSNNQRTAISFLLKLINYVHMIYMTETSKWILLSCHYWNANWHSNWYWHDQRDVFVWVTAHENFEEHSKFMHWKQVTVWCRGLLSLSTCHVQEMIRLRGWVRVRWFILEAWLAQL